jgi:hypothetical protein
VEGLYANVHVQQLPQAARKSAFGLLHRMLSLYPDEMHAMPDGAFIDGYIVAVDGEVRIVPYNNSIFFFTANMFLHFIFILTLNKRRFEIIY